MPVEALKAIIAECGGPSKIAHFVFDNSITVTFQNGVRDEFSEDDLIELGGTWFYREHLKFRNAKTGEYDVEAYAYHPLDCLQNVITGDMSRIDQYQRVDMLI